MIFQYAFDFVIVMAACYGVAWVLRMKERCEAEFEAQFHLNRHFIREFLDEEVRIEECQYDLDEIQASEVEEQEKAA